jgi:hypothetical protein
VEDGIDLCGRGTHVAPVSGVADAQACSRDIGVSAPQDSHVVSGLREIVDELGADLAGAGDEVSHIELLL